MMIIGITYPDFSSRIFGGRINFPFFTSEYLENVDLIHEIFFYKKKKKIELVEKLLPPYIPNLYLIMQKCDIIFILSF